MKEVSVGLETPVNTVKSWESGGLENRLNPLAGRGFSGSLLRRGGMASDWNISSHGLLLWTKGVTPDWLSSTSRVHTPKPLSCPTSGSFRLAPTSKDRSPFVDQKPCSRFILS
jgi:hypothetical protein